MDRLKKEPVAAHRQVTLYRTALPLSYQNPPLIKRKIRCKMIENVDLCGLQDLG